jgi:hypothetical protein
MKKLLFLSITVAIAVLLTDCSKSFNNDGTGRLVIRLTDAPFPFENIETANVTISKVELRKVGDGIPDGNPFVTVSEEIMNFNLLELRNGITAALADIEIPAGTYNLIRLYVDEASLETKDGAAFDVKVPSGQQTGIKIRIKPEITVEGGLTSELLIDFDLSRSFILRGNPDKPSGMTGFIFKPVIRAVNNTTAGRVEGTVINADDLAVENAEVWIEQDTLVATSYTDDSGKYAFLGIPAGTYSLFATKENYDTVSYAGVQVTAGNRTVKDFILKVN